MTAIGHNNGPPVDWRDYGGFIVEARDSRDHPIVGYGHPVKPADDRRGSYSYNEAWRDLLHECRYQDGYVMNGGQKMLVRRGELVGAVSWLANRWNWSPKAVRVFLDKLEDDGMIARSRPGSEAHDTDRYKGNRNGNQANVLKVCNYEKFNTPQPVQQQSPGQSKGNQAAIEGQSRGHIYKDNKGTKEQDQTISFASSDERVTFEKGELQLFNGVRQFWLNEFGDEHALNLALKQAAGYVQPNSSRPLEAQVSSQLARMARDKRDKDARYSKAAKDNAKGGKSCNRMSLEDLSANVDAAYERLHPSQPKQARLTHER